MPSPWPQNPSASSHAVHHEGDAGDEHAHPPPDGRAGPTLKEQVEAFERGDANFIRNWSYVYAISSKAPANPMTDLMTQTMWAGYQPQRTPAAAMTPAWAIALLSKQISRKTLA